MKRPTCVFNLTAVPRENTYEIQNKMAMQIIALGGHVILLVDDDTKFGRVTKAIDFFMLHALSVKVVDSEFKQQYMLTLKDFSNE